MHDVFLGQDRMAKERVVDAKRTTRGILEQICSRYEIGMALTNAY